MKARTIKKLRKKILSKGYYKERAEHFSNELENLNDFYTSKCNSFFVGYERAEYNRRIYDSYYGRISAKFDWYMERLNQ
jgi:hypothetical protein